MRFKAISILLSNNSKKYSKGNSNSINQKICKYLNSDCRNWSKSRLSFTIKMSKLWNNFNYRKVTKNHFIMNQIMTMLQILVTHSPTRIMLDESTTYLKLVFEKMSSSKLSMVLKKYLTSHLLYYPSSHVYFFLNLIIDHQGQC